MYVHLIDNRYSELTISQTTISHSGNYSCVTNNAVSSSTLVHIFNGESESSVLLNLNVFFSTPNLYISLGENPAELLRDYGIAMKPKSPALMLSLLLTIVTYQIFCLCAL